MAAGFAVSAVTGVEHVVLGDRRGDVLPRRRPRPDPGPGHRGDHGLAAARPRPASARPSTTPPASSAARSASPSSAACSRRSTPPRSAPRWPARRSRSRRSTSPRSRSAAAEVVAQQAGQQGGPQAEAFVHTAINNSFVDGWHAGSWVCFGVVLVGAAGGVEVAPCRADPRAARTQWLTSSATRSLSRFANHCRSDLAASGLAHAAHWARRGLAVVGLVSSRGPRRPTSTRSPPR